jgi:8-amino-7-oxononanoate synthase
MRRMSDCGAVSGERPENPFYAALEARRARGLYREAVVLDGAPGKWITRTVSSADGTPAGEPRRCLNLASNNSLDLAGHPRLMEGARAALEQAGTTSGGSRLLGGNLPLHAALEQAVEAYRPAIPGGRATAFNTGFQANLTVVSALGELLGGVFADKHAHASVAEGLRVLPRSVPFHRFAHNDADHLESLLKAHQPRGGGLVVTETLFSMDGDTAPFEALCALQKHYGFWLLLDEAHSTGCWPMLHARGLAGIPERTILLGTFGKALGSFGAYVVGAPEVREALWNFGRGFVFSTALPPAVLGANIAALHTVSDPAESWRAEKLAAIAAFARTELHRRGFGTGDSVGHIVPVLLGTPARALAISAALLETGFHVPAIRPPTVPEGTARLRLSLTAALDEADMVALIAALEHAVLIVDRAGVAV